MIALKEIKYTDDGCTVYQCSECCSEIETRTCPVYSDWHFCPHCGVKFEALEFLPESGMEKSIPGWRSRIPK